MELFNRSIIPQVGLDISPENVRALIIANSGSFSFSSFCWLLIYQNSGLKGSCKGKKMATGLPNITVNNSSLCGAIDIELFP